jgi:hypothetical protein
MVKQGESTKGSTKGGPPRGVPQGRSPKEVPLGGPPRGVT